MDGNRRKGVRWAVGMAIVVVGGILAAVIVSSLRPMTEARVHSPLPKLWTFVPRGRFDGKPWLDLPWIGGSRLRYPKTVAMPKNFKVHADLAGIILFNSPVGATSPIGMGSLSDLYFPMATWTSDGREAWLSNSEFNALNREFAYLPFVFGSKSKKFRCTWPSFPVTSSAPNTLDIELPGNGKPAPPLKPLEVKMGGWTVHFRPRPWLGPSFTIDYEVTVEGLPASDLCILHVNSRFYGNLNDFVIDPKEATVVSLSPNMARSLGLRLTTTRRDPFTATVAPWASTFLEVRRNGKPFCLLFDSMGRQAFTSQKRPERPRIFSQIDGTWVDSPPLRNLDFNRLIAQITSTKKYKVGQVISGIEYLPVESKRADVKTDWQDLKSYPSAAEFFAKQRLNGP